MRSYTSNSGHLTADTIVIYNSNWVELDRTSNRQSYTFSGLNPGTVYVEIYEDDMMVDDKQVTITAGSTQTVNLYANAKVDLEAKVRYSDGSDFPGATVKLYNHAGLFGTKTADSNGEVEWSVYPSTQSGEYYYLEVYDGSQKVGQRNQFSITSSTTYSITTSASAPAQTGDLRVRSYTSNSGHLTADTIVIYNSNWVELDRTSNRQSYTFSGLNPGTVYVEIYEDDMMVDDKQVTITAGSTQTVNLYANAKVDLEAKVRYSDGSDFPGATVKLYNHAGLFGTKTADSNGEVEWSVYPSTQSGEYYYLEVYDGSQKVGQRNQFSITSSTTYSITTSASAPAQTGDLRVRSYTSNSGHLTADTIVIYNSNWVELDRTSNRQSYTFSGLNPGTVYVEIYEDDMMVADDQDTVTAGSTQTVNLYANAKVDLEAKVRYSDGSDFPGATVKLYNHAGLFGTKTADSNGEVEWSVYPSTQSGEYYYLEVYDGSQKVGQRNQFSITSSTTYSITTSASAPAQTGDLRVRSYTSNSGHLTADAIVIYNSNWVELDRTSNRQSYTFSGLNPGTVYVEIYEDDMMVDDKQVTITAGSTQTVNLYANAKVDLEAKVRYSDGSDFPGATVKLYNHAGLFGTKTADSNGEVEWSVYPSTQSGEYYKLEVYDASGTKIGEKLDFQLTSSASYSITTSKSLSTTGELTVRSFTSSGSSSLEASVIIIYDDNWNEIDRRYNDSDHTFSGVKAGDILIEAYIDDILVSSRQINVRAGGGTIANLYANDKMSLDLKIMYSDGQTELSGAKILLYSHSQLLREKVANSIGESKFWVYPTTASGEGYSIVVKDSAGNRVGEKFGFRVTADATYRITTTKDIPRESRFAGGDISPNVVQENGDKLTFDWEGSLEESVALKIYHVAATQGLSDDRTLGWTSGPSSAIETYPLSNGMTQLRWNLPDMASQMVLIRIVAVLPSGQEVFLHEEQVFTKGADGNPDLFDSQTPAIRAWRMHSLDPNLNYFENVQDWDSSKEALVWCTTPVPMADGQSWDMQGYPVPILIERPSSLQSPDLFSIVSPNARIRHDAGILSHFDLGWAVDDAVQTKSNLNAVPTGDVVFDALRASSFNCLGWTTVQGTEPGTWSLDGVTPLDSAGMEGLLDRADAEQLMVLPWYGHDAFLAGSANMGLCSSTHFATAFLLIVPPHAGADWRSRCGGQVYGHDACVSQTTYAYAVGGTFICERFDFDIGYSDRQWFEAMVAKKRDSLEMNDISSVVIWTAVLVLDALTGPLVPVAGCVKASSFIMRGGLQSVLVARYTAETLGTMVRTFGEEAAGRTVRHQVLSQISDGGVFKTAVMHSNDPRAPDILNSMAFSLSGIDRKIRGIAKADVAAGNAASEADRIAELYEIMCLERRSPSSSPDHCLNKFLLEDGIFQKALRGEPFSTAAIGSLKGTVGELKAAYWFALPEACHAECMKNLLGTYSSGQPDLVVSGVKGRLLAELGGDSISHGKVFTGHVKDKASLSVSDATTRAGLIKSAEDGHAASLICTDSRSFSVCERLVRQLAIDYPILANKFSVTLIDQTGMRMKWFGTSETPWRSVNIDPRGAISISINSGLGRSSSDIERVALSCSCSENEPQQIDFKTSEVTFWHLGWGIAFIDDMNTLTVVVPSLASTILVTVTDAEGVQQSSAHHLSVSGESVVELLREEVVSIEEGLMMFGDGTSASVKLSNECIVSHFNSVCTGSVEDTYDHENQPNQVIEPETGQTNLEERKDNADSRDPELLIEEAKSSHELAVNIFGVFLILILVLVLFGISRDLLSVIRH